MNDNEKSFLMFYMEQTWIEMRHIETLRERVAILVITVASLIAGFIIQQKFAIETKIFAWFIIFLGIFGFTMTLKLYQIHSMDQKRLDKWYQYFIEFCGEDPQILLLRDMADTENKENFSVIKNIRHNYFWSMIHILIACMGIIILSTYPTKSQPLQMNENTTSQTVLDSSSNAPKDTVKK